MTSIPNYTDVPILLLDIESFQTLYPNLEQKRAAIQVLQDILRKSAHFFSPYSDVWAKWKRHGTGDGYYIVLDSLAPQVALSYALRIREALTEFNQDRGLDLPIRLRMVQAFGDVEWGEDQALSNAMIEAERFMSAETFKQYSARQESPASLAITSLFHFKLQNDLSGEPLFEGLDGLTWSPVRIRDKHGELRAGYVLGLGWEEREEPGTPPPAPVRVTILIGHFLEQPLPEAVEMAKRAARDFKDAGLRVDVRVDIASVISLKRTALEGCDLLIYYGHGTEEGLLSFEDGLKAYSHLSEDIGLGQFWKDLQACMVFACFGDRFATQLPCAWVAFVAPVFRLAPKGFLNAAIGRLKTMELSSAIEQAGAECESQMDSTFSRDMTFSAKPLPLLRFSPGKASLIRLSPGLSGLERVDFASLEQEDYRYPDHEPFVGHVVELKSLMRLPSTRDDRPLQRFIWVHGDAGMGKSALLRQFALSVRDLAFHDAESPVYLLHLYCYKLTKSNEVVNLLCETARSLYGLAETPKSIASLFSVVRDRAGVHVWILDDLTYLSVKPDRNDEAYQLVGRIRANAQASAMPLEVVVSTRRPGPKGFEAIPVTGMSLYEALLLARLIHVIHGQGNGAVAGPPDLAGAALLFQHVHGSPALYKRSLLLALERGMSFGAYADELMMKGSLDYLDAKDMAKRMVEYEVDQLSSLEATHGFAYSRFLRICYRLFARASFFTVEELASWFEESLRAGYVKEPLLTQYGNGLTYLTRLNFLSLERRPQGTAFALPPNQRDTMRALDDRSVDLPDGIRLRGARERLSLALERAKTVGVEALAEFQDMEEDYRPHLSDPSAAAAVFYAMMVRAEIVEWGYLSHPLSAKLIAVSILDEIVGSYDLHRGEYPPGEKDAATAAAKALCNKGVRLGVLGRSEDEVAVYDEVVRRFGDRPEAELAEQVATALFNKGVRLGVLGRSEDAVAVYDEVVRRFGDRPEPQIKEVVALALQILDKIRGSGDQ